MDLFVVVIAIGIVVFFFWTGYDTYRQAAAKGRNAWGWFALWLMVGLITIGWVALFPWVAIRMLGPVHATTPGAPRDDTPQDDVAVEVRTGPMFEKVEPVDCRGDSPECMGQTVARGGVCAPCRRLAAQASRGWPDDANPEGYGPLVLRTCWSCRDTETHAPDGLCTPCWSRRQVPAGSRTRPPLAP